MKPKDFGAYDHTLVNGIDELQRKISTLSHFTYNKGGSTFITITLTDNNGGITKAAILMTEDDLPEKISRNDFKECFLDNIFNEVSDKTIFLCRIDSNNNILESKHYSRHTHFI